MTITTPYCLPIVLANLRVYLVCFFTLYFYHYWTKTLAIVFFFNSLYLTWKPRTPEHEPVCLEIHYHKQVLLKMSKICRQNINSKAL